MADFFTYTSLFLGATALICMGRVIIGPTVGDRLIGINVIGTKTLVLIVLSAAILKESFFIDVALVYALISFIGSFVIAREINETTAGREQDE